MYQSNLRHIMALRFLSVVAVLVVLGHNVLLSSGFVPTIVLYTGQNFTGSSLTLAGEKIRDLTPYSETFRYFASACHTGMWMFVMGPDFDTSKQALRIGWAAENRCENLTAPGFAYFLANSSLRHFGPADMSKSSVSFYSDIFGSGREQIVDQAASSFLFEPKSLFTTGLSSWLFFSEPKYLGDRYCFSSTQNGQFVDIINGIPEFRKIGSVAQIDDCLLYKNQSPFIPKQEDNRLVRKL